MTTKPAVALHLVSWNSRQHLPGALASIITQAYQPLNVLLIDNASVDGTMAWLNERYPQFHVLRNTRNLGFARAHNQGILLTDAPYIVMMNPDVILAPDWVARGVEYLETHPEVGSFGGKLLRFDYSNDELREVQFSGIIDSTGLVGNRARHFIDRGSGEEDQGQYDQPEPVFGFSGALVMYRRTALESVRYNDEYIDDDFFAYKDDTDLAWRMQRLGWTAWYDPTAIAHHHRTIKGVSAATDRLIARNHRSRSMMNSYYSYRNHWLMLQKNERWSTIWRDWPWMAWYEIKKSIYLLWRRPAALRAWREILRLRRAMKKKAQMLDQHARATPLEVRRWFV